MEKYKIKIVERLDGSGRLKAYLYKQERLVSFLPWFKYWAVNDMVSGDISYLSSWISVWQERHNVIEIVDKSNQY